MKKLITFIIAFAAATSIATAAGPRFGESLGKLSSQLERINTVLGDEEKEISDGRRAALEHRAEMLALQIDVRKAVKEAVQGLEEDATKEEIKAVVHGVRVQFKDQFQALKEERRAIRAERRANREVVEEEAGEEVVEG